MRTKEQFVWNLSFERVLLLFANPSMFEFVFSTFTTGKYNKTTMIYFKSVTKAHHE